MFHVKRINENILSLVSNLPKNPGVYKFKDFNEKIIYIGKAKNLNKRVSSYFNKNFQDAKTQLLVSKITNIEYVVVGSENDALLLENNLIKQYKPRYNILLKDDKSYPWICITNEPFPKVFKTRRILNTDYHYFGPYSSGYLLRTLLNLIKQLFQLRNCNYNLTKDNIEKKKFKACLEYQIGNCLAPCIGLQNSNDYDNNIQQIINILKGNLREINKYLKSKMLFYSNSLEYEKANDIKNKLQILDNFQTKSIITNPKINNIDVFSITKENEYAFVNYLKINNGCIIQVHNLLLKQFINETDSDLLLNSIQNIRELYKSKSEKIVVPFNLDFKLNNVKFIVPKRGELLKLLELSQNNIKHFKHDFTLKRLRADYGKINIRLLEEIKNTLQLPELPVHIECFDNSNTQGTNPVASCVVFKNGKPSKSDYRHFNIKTVVGPDDFASMEEIVERRYKRLIEEKEHLPQLIIIDGGKGQINAANKALIKLNLNNKISLISIAKKLEEIYKVNDSIPLYLDKRSEVLKLIQRMRDEAHRFGITFHRNKRSNEFIKSELQNIRGIGEKTIEILLKEFKSVENIKNTPSEAFEKIIGKVKTKFLITYFSNSQSSITSD